MAEEVDAQVVVHPPEAPKVIEQPSSSKMADPAPTWSEVIESEITNCPRPLPSGSALGLSISLIHNATGQVLWHGSQQFNIQADGQRLYNLMEHFLKKMPISQTVPLLDANQSEAAEKKGLGG